MTTWDAMKETWPCPQVWAVGAEKTFHLHSVNEACWFQIPVLLVHLVQCFLISAVIHPQLVLKQGIWNQLPEIHPFCYWKTLLRNVTWILGFIGLSTDLLCKAISPGSSKCCWYQWHWHHFSRKARTHCVLVGDSKWMSLQPTLQ